MAAANNILTTVPSQSLNVFVSNKPRDIVHGLGGGIANLGIGIVGGVGMIVAAPIYCAYIGGEANGVVGGLAGFGIGIGIGIVGSCILVVGGIYTCLTQVVGGLCNSPEAVGAQCGGKEWDADGTL